MIFAWNNADPVTGNGDWRYHGPQQHINRATILLTSISSSVTEQNICGGK